MRDDDSAREHHAAVRAEVARIATALTAAPLQEPVRHPAEEARWRRIVAAHYPVLGELRERREQLEAERWDAHCDLLRRAERMEKKKGIPAGVLAGAVGLHFTRTRQVPRDIRITSSGPNAMVEYGEPWMYCPAFPVELLAHDSGLPGQIRSAALRIPTWKESIHYAAVDDRLAEAARLFGESVAAATTSTELPGFCESCPTPAPQPRRGIRDRLTNPAKPWGFVLLTIVAGVVIAFVTNHAPLVGSGSSGPQASTDSSSAGITITVVPQDPVGGAAIYPVPNDLRRPSDFVRAGVTLQVDCLQIVEPNYLFARISDGLYRNHWIDAFDTKTPRGDDVRRLSPPLPSCGSTVTLVPEITVSP